MSLAHYLESSWSQLRQQLLQLSAILVVSLVTIILVLRRRLLAPIHHLTSDAHLLAAENLSVPIAVDHDDELGQVALAMEHMRRRLLESFSQLQQANQELLGYASTLESRVSERTAALKLANDELQETLSSLKQAQNSLVEAEKLASLGRLVAGVAHELNTPIGSALTVITDCEQADHDVQQAIASEALRRTQLLRYVERSRAGHEIAARNLVRAAAIIRNFKQLAIDQTSDMRRRFSLAAVIEDVLTSIRPGFKHTPYRIEVTLAQEIEMDSFPGPLGQVITNIAMNAVIHAFAGRDAGLLAISGRLTDAGEVAITFRDDGCGMEATTVSKIFEPFFTTRFGQGGSGLGMHIVYSFVTGILGGRIEVSSEPGHGSCFLITLPPVAPDRSSVTP